MTELKWIPAAESTPRMYQQCIVTQRGGSVLTLYYLGDDYWDKHVVAWMPCPKAYEVTDND